MHILEDYCEIYRGEIILENIGLKWGPMVNDGNVLSTAILRVAKEQQLDAEVLYRKSSAMSVLLTTAIRSRTAVELAL
jgi:hypothetical protein